MLIQTLGKKYDVIQYIFSDNNMERYLCREEDTNERYTIVRIKSREWIVESMDFFMQQMKDEHFTDFISCFVSDEFLHIVMRHTDGISLTEKLDNEETTREERLAIAKALFDKMMIQNMPDFFLLDCLKPSNIILTKGLETEFKYELAGGVNYKKARFSQVQARLAKVMEKLFSYEIRHKTVTPILRFYQSLRRGEYGELVEAYTAYDKMCKEIEETPEGNLVMPKTLPFRVWDKICKTFRPLKRILAVLLFIAAVVFLIYSVRDSMQSGDRKKVFDRIGTLEIKDKNTK